MLKVLKVFVETGREKKSIFGFSSLSRASLYAGGTPRAREREGGLGFRARRRMTELVHQGTRRNCPNGRFGSKPNQT